MDRIKFQVNGIECSVGSEVSSTTTLLDYLRNTLELRGTKYMCLEAGCGACIVTATKGNGEVPQGVNACMVSVTSCQDWDITTIEKIGNRLDGYHPVQKTLAEHNGTQCGYCSPGWVMAMYSLLKTKKMTMLEIEQSFGSNICRCTGYRPILEAFKKFASDAPDPQILPDIEDLQLCDKTGEICVKKNCDDSDWCFVSGSDMQSGVKSIKLCDDRYWYRVETLADIFDIWHANGVQSYMLIAGNTGKGAFPILEYPKILIDISGVSELKGYSIDQNLIVGAGNTLTDVISIFTTMSTHEDFEYLNILNDHIKLVAHIPVRNLGTVAGNLMLKNKSNGFPSDIYLLFETVGAQLTIVSAPGDSKILTMQDFLNEDMTGKIILNVLLPPLNAAHKITTFKIMPRSQSAHAIVQAGFNYKLNEAGVVVDSRIVYGGLSEVFTRAWKTEAYLRGKALFRNETLQAALKVLNAELVVTEALPAPPVENRRQIALSLFYKGLLSLCPLKTLHPRYYSGAVNIHETRPVSDGKQVFTTDPTIWPLNKPFPKLDALIQCAGETKYTEDVPSLPGEVYAVFVLSTVARGKIDSIDPSKALSEPGVIAFYSVSDIPGQNTFTPPISILHPKHEELLCDGEVKFFNQPIGIIVAESQKLAEKAATMVEVKYSNLKAPEIDIREAITDPAKVSLAGSFEATKVGTDVFKIIKGENTIYGQYNFTMETLVCVTLPTEEGLLVYAATQSIDTVQRTISRLLNLEQNRVDVFVRRLGGGFGYKISRATQICGASSLVAFKLNRPCRFIQPLTHNMRAIGKRTPCTSNFEMGVNAKGEIQYVNHNLYDDNGYIYNEPIVSYGIDLYSNVYKSEAWTHKSYNTVTDTPSNSWVRSPGSLEHVAMAENIMERIAYELNLDSLEVRLSNLDREKHGPIQEMLDTLKSESQYDERKVAVDKFNSENRWTKRGLKYSFLRWSPLGPIYFNVTLTVFQDDGTVAITHGGVEMGQGINTKAIQICAYLLKIPVEKIKIKPNDTMIAPNSCFTGGSITSHNIGIGVRRCCEQLLARLEPVRTQLTDPTWEVLIKTAFERNIDLQVHGFVNTDDFQSYEVHGITLAEVEIDVLTGEWEIIRVDLIEDVGRSVNPELDVGQVEGAFIFGVGYWTTERLVYNHSNGELLTNRTWDYWVPQARDIPQDFRIYFKKGSFSTDVILGAKATGEPATNMGIVIPFAMRAAIAAAREEAGIPKTQWFQIDGPYTVDKIAYFCKNKLEDFKFY
ncbi:xanthine dehydrogenase 1-like [Vanessa atalanta]|uniref:xanthine dehydrogenase 1-like n=1 Tax=Vanessa atalanta TaxID=42275 RepID=UPI001FCCECF8|nr:xanthine dehydrogenase 1-like [Vanessa atalanta]